MDAIGTLADDASTLRVVVVIPALNEEASLPLVIKDLPPVQQIIVCDNRSTDATAQVAQQAGALVVHEAQQGYGSACLRGLAEIESLIDAGRPRPDVVAFVDADYSDHADKLSELLAPLERGDADFVLGSRLLGKREPGAMPPQSLYGNHFACWLMKVLFGGGYTDLGPFRVIRYESLRLLEMEDRDFGWTVEMQLKALQHGLRYCEVPVPYRRRVGVSKISGTLTGTIRAGWKILFLIAKYGFLKQTSHSSRPSSAETESVRHSSPAVMNASRKKRSV